MSKSNKRDTQTFVILGLILVSVIYSCCIATVAVLDKGDISSLTRKVGKLETYLTYKNNIKRACQVVSKEFYNNVPVETDLGKDLMGHCHIQAKFGDIVGLPVFLYKEAEEEAMKAFYLKHKAKQ